MSAQAQVGIAGINQAALQAIEDQNARIVIQSIVDGLNVRNGITGSKGNRFVTLNEIEGVKREYNTLANSLARQIRDASEQSSIIPPGEISRIINELQGQIMASPLFVELGIEIENIDTALAAEVAARIAAILAEAAAREADVQGLADDLAAEAAARLAQDTVLGGDISTLQSVTDTQATQITGLLTRVDDAESSIITLQDTTADQATALTALTTRTDEAESDISNLQTTTADQATALTALTTRTDDAESAISTLQTTTADQATALTTLDSRVDNAESSITTLQSTTAGQTTLITNLTTRVDDAESNIGTLQTTTAGHASQLTTLSVQIGEKSKLFYQPTEPVSDSNYTLKENDLWFDSDNGNRPYRWDGSDWVEASDTRIAAAEAAISSETTARVNADNAITTYVNTQFSAIDGVLSAISTDLTTVANSAAANATAITTVQSNVDGLSATVSTNYTTLVDITGTINAKYTVKIDANGYVTGYGLISAANNGTPVSEFVVRADKFAIGTATGPGITPRVPFIVLTSTDGDGNPPGVYMDMAAIKDASILAAKIKNAEITTLKLAGNAVFVPVYQTGYSVSAFTANTFAQTLIWTSLTIDGLGAGETAGVIIQGAVSYYPTGSGAKTLTLEIYVESFNQGGTSSSLDNFGITAGTMCMVELGNGTYNFYLRVRTDSGTKQFNFEAFMIAMAGKR